MGRLGTLLENETPPAIGTVDFAVPFHSQIDHGVAQGPVAAIATDAHLFHFKDFNRLAWHPRLSLPLNPTGPRCRPDLQLRP